MASNWSDKKDATYNVRATFATGDFQFTTLEHAADLADFIDREKGIADLLAGVPIRTKLGTVLTTTDIES